ncbi:MAG: hypothetical protein QOD53_2128, partial [Thermoleophilaceae bacterium]|nr:hypothetical protein [Thermoleophilaceae bacterium]
MIAKVEPLTPARALRGPFDYRLPGEMDGVDVGSMLVVPFGRRRLLGVVVELSETSELPPERLVQPLAALDRGVPAELVKLGLWVADEYCSTPARGLALVLPPGAGIGALPRVGIRRALTATIAPEGVAALGGGARLGERQRAALEALREGPVTVAHLARLTGCDHSTLRSLEARGYVQLERAEQRRRPAIASVGARAAHDLQLTDGQRHSLRAIEQRMDAPSPGAGLLLHGVTGSGKTEVYLRAAAAALERGRSAIVLVPEIALTPQTAARFEQRFGDTVAVLHSRMSAGERHDEWLRLRRGQARVCVGPRSAVFAPLSDLGLIVVDEEHDSSYKQDAAPRYDARQVAARRARAAGAAVVYGTATPRPETWHALPRRTLRARPDGSPLPRVEIV